MRKWWFRMPPVDRAHWWNLVAAPSMLVLFTFLTHRLWVLLPLAIFCGAAMHNSLFAFWLDHDLKTLAVKETT